MKSLTMQEARAFIGQRVHWSDPDLSGLIQVNTGVLRGFYTVASGCNNVSTELPPFTLPAPYRVEIECTNAVISKIYGGSKLITISVKDISPCLRLKNSIC